MYFDPAKIAGVTASECEKFFENVREKVNNLVQEIGRQYFRLAPIRMNDLKCGGGDSPVRKYPVVVRNQVLFSAWMFYGVSPFANVSKERLNRAIEQIELRSFAESPFNQSL